MYAIFLHQERLNQTSTPKKESSYQEEDTVNRRIIEFNKGNDDPLERQDQAYQCFGGNESHSTISTQDDSPIGSVEMSHTSEYMRRKNLPLENIFLPEYVKHEVFVPRHGAVETTTPPNELFGKGICYSNRNEGFEKENLEKRTSELCSRNAKRSSVGPGKSRPPRIRLFHKSTFEVVRLEI
jgi:hypothetical protein